MTRAGLMSEGFYWDSWHNDALCFWLGINEETCNSRHAGSHRWPRLMILRKVEQQEAGESQSGTWRHPEPLISLTWSQHGFWTFQLREPLNGYL